MNRSVLYLAGVLVVSAGLVVAAVALAAPARAQAGGFSDVAEDVYYSRAVAELAAGGVFAGTECGEGFCPDEAIDRKTMAVWVVRMLDGGDPPPVPRSRFGDVDADSFHGPFIERMAELEVTSGCGDGTNFCPHRSVTRAQMAVFLSRAYDLADGPDPGFADVAADAWYATAVARLARSGITTGCGDGTVFCPSRPTTRAQTAAFLWRAETGFGRGGEEFVDDDGSTEDERPLTTQFDIDDVTVDVYLCAQEGRFDSTHLANEVKLLNDNAVPWFESQFGNSGASIRFAAGVNLSFAAAEWTVQSLDSLHQAEEHGAAAPCGTASLPDGSSQREALIVADFPVGGTGTHGFARQPGGPAWVVYRENLPERTYGFERDQYWIAAAAHEIGHSVYNFRHPWRRWAPPVSEFCAPARNAARGHAVRQRELESLMSWASCDGIYDLRAGRGAFFACADRRAQGWIAEDACDGPVDPSRVPGAPALTGLVPGDGSLQLEWSAPSGPAVVTDYDVSYRRAGTDAWTEWRSEDVSTRRSATITGLTNGVRYEVVVWAHNQHAVGPLSRPMFGTPQAPGPGTLPQPGTSREIGPRFGGPKQHTWFVNHYDSRYRYTCKSDDPRQKLTWAVWSWPNTPAGSYRVEVFIPPQEATAIVRYEIGRDSAGLVIDPVRLNQAHHRGSWATVANVDFPGGRLWLLLGDYPSEASGPNDRCADRDHNGDHSIGAANARIVATTSTTPTPGTEAPSEPLGASANR